MAHGCKTGFLTFRTKVLILKKNKQENEKQKWRKKRSVTK